MRMIVITFHDEASADRALDICVPSNDEVLRKGGTVAIVTELTVLQLVQNLLDEGFEQAIDFNINLEA